MRKAHVNFIGFQQSINFATSLSVILFATACGDLTGTSRSKFTYHSTIKNSGAKSITAYFDFNGNLDDRCEEGGFSRTINAGASEEVTVNAKCRYVPSNPHIHITADSLSYSTADFFADADEISLDEGQKVSLLLNGTSEVEYVIGTKSSQVSPTNQTAEVDFVAWRKRELEVGDHPYAYASDSSASKVKGRSMDFRVPSEVKSLKLKIPKTSYSQNNQVQFDTFLPEGVEVIGDWVVTELKLRLEKNTIGPKRSYHEVDITCDDLGCKFENGKYYD